MRRVCVAVAGAACLMPAPATSAVRVLDPAAYAQLRIVGATSVATLADAGDVNGDGIDDVIVGDTAAGTSRFGYDWYGSAYIVFGARERRTVDVGLLWKDEGVGYELRNADSASFAGGHVAGLGDVNGDRLDDVAIGASGTGGWIVFGSRSTDRVDLGQLGSRGLRIYHPPPVSTAEEYAAPTGGLAAAGDVNADGRGDVVVTAGALRGWFTTKAEGDAWIVFSSARTGTLDLTSLGDAGVEVKLPGGEMPYFPAGVGDLDGDGRADVGLGVPYAGHNGRTRSGSTYVVFGRTEPGTIDVTAPDAPVLTIDGAAVGDEAAVPAAAGDMDGGGAPDLAIGAPWTSHGGRLDSGSVYVLTGPRAPGRVDLAMPDTHWAVFEGATGSSLRNGGDRAGAAVAGLGDLDGDLRAELAIGAPGFDGRAGNDTGATFVVSGGNGGRVDLATLTGGSRIDSVSAELAPGPPGPGSLLAGGTRGFFALDPLGSVEPAVAPPVTLGPRRRRLRRQWEDYRVGLVVECPGSQTMDCSGDVVVRHGKHTSAPATFRFVPGSSGRVRLEAPASVVRALMTSSEVVVDAVATVHRSEGEPVRTHMRPTILRPCERYIPVELRAPKSARVGQPVRISVTARPTFSRLLRLEVVWDNLGSEPIVGAQPFGKDVSARARHVYRSPGKEEIRIIAAGRQARGCGEKSLSFAVSEIEIR